MLTRDPVILFVVGTAYVGAYVAACAMTEAGYRTTGAVLFIVSLCFLVASALISCGSTRSDDDPV